MLVLAVNAVGSSLYLKLECSMMNVHRVQWVYMESTSSVLRSAAFTQGSGAFFTQR